MALAELGCSNGGDAANCIVMSTPEAELRRLQRGPSQDEQAFVIRVSFTADDPAAVIARVREVLAAVLARVEAWPTEERWPDLLPSWFVERCAPEQPDAAAALARWQALTPEEKLAHSQGPWALSAWLHYFDPTEEGGGDDRSWWWWAAGTDQPGTGWIDVATEGWPFGSGSLYWLIEASGGVDPGY
jgi:hypothetical protein